MSSGANNRNQYHMHNTLKANLDKYFALNKKDHDFLVCVDGAEGSGKTTIAFQCAYYLSQLAGHEFTLDNVCFDAEGFEKRVRSAKRYEAIVLDEAYLALNARQAMSRINKSLNAMLTEIRERNLFIFIVLPSFFDLDRYVAIWRSQCLIHVTYDNARGTMDRGVFAFFSVKKKKSLYIKGKKFYNYYGVPPNFIGRFTKYLPIDEQEYRTKKREITLNRNQPIQITSKEKRLRHRMGLVVYRLRYHHKWVWRKIGELLDVTDKGASIICKDFEQKMEKSQKIGGSNVNLERIYYMNEGQNDIKYTPPTSP